MKIAAFLVTAGVAAVAVAGPIDMTGFDRSLATTANVEAISVDMPRSFQPDQYFSVPAIGSSLGFALAGGPFATSTFDFVDENIGAAIAGGSVFTSEFFSTDVPNNAPNGSTGTLQLDHIASTATPDLFPAGVTVGGQPATRAGFFMGANAGGNPLTNDKPVIVTSVIWFAFDAAGGQVWATDVTALVPTNGDGTWTGSFGVGFNNFGAGLGVIQQGLLIDYTVVPAPASMALLGLGGLVATRRRR